MTSPFSRFFSRPLNRREFLNLSALLTTTSCTSLHFPFLGEKPKPTAPARSSLTFANLPHGLRTTHEVPANYNAQILLRWGDPIFAKAPAFAPLNQRAESQEKQFGYNADFTAFLPLPKGSTASDHGLLCVNHEYSIARLMFPPLDELSADIVGPSQTDIERAAHGHSIVEIIRDEQFQWKILPESSYNRRISARNTPCTFTGPAARHARLKTKAAPGGDKVLGTLGNCSGGVTPWGTVLIAEENFDTYFRANPHASAEEKKRYERFGIQDTPHYHWHRFLPQFDLEKEPNSANQFGWMVEIDPYNPSLAPKKRTALGRFKHENAAIVQNKDGRIVIYMGDDQYDEYIYRFISDEPYRTNAPEAAATLLDHGTLYVAECKENKELHWHPLSWGTGNLTTEKGFNSQAEILIDTRFAADAVGATPMDRPEGIAVHPKTGTIYVSLTKHPKRAKANPASPRTPNPYGHILEFLPPKTNEGADHSAPIYRWNITLLGGDPRNADDHAQYDAQNASPSFLCNPDNLACDPSGHLWITTDGMQASKHVSDGLYAMDTEGEGRALLKHFLNAPRGAEVTGPSFTPDGTTLFVSIQHPSDEPDANFDTPTTRWPDFNDTLPPRPSVIAITHSEGKTIGT